MPYKNPWSSNASASSPKPGTPYATGTHDTPSVAEMNGVGDDFRKWGGDVSAENHALTLLQAFQFIPQTLPTSFEAGGAIPAGTLAMDAGGTLQKYDGASWTPVGAIAVQRAASNASLTLTTSLQDIPAATLTLATAGTWLIIGCFDFAGSGSDSSAVGAGHLNFDGVDQATTAPTMLMTAAGSALRNTVTQLWLVTASAAGKVAKLQALKTGGTGTSNTGGANTSITAMRVG